MKQMVFWSYTFLSVSVAVPAALIVTETDVTKVLEIGEPSEKPLSWLYSPSFAIKDVNGTLQSYSIAFKMADRGEINSLCKWMPVIRDSMNSTLGSAKRAYLADGMPDTRPLLSGLKNRLHSILVQHETRQIGIVPSDAIPATPTGPEAVAVCYNGRVYEAGRRGPNTKTEIQ